MHLKPAARGSLKIQDAKSRQKSGHHRTTLCGYIFATKARIDNRKKPEYLSSNISSSCPHNMANFGPLAAEIGFGSLRHPYEFQRVSRLDSVTASHSSSERQPDFASLNRGRHLCSAGRPLRWALAHILVNTCSPSTLDSESQTASRPIQPFCTAHGREAVYFAMCRFPLKNDTSRLGGIWTPIQGMVPWALPSPYLNCIPN